ncbi:MAG TPA: nucleotidyl transferase AbiEii/AbiGii toxin family protein [Conexivisphaerales archaeon]|nr:nucleotidyl transferase AbiEii/AbiGii toxin family protein [Conexivisphaerales archaeon]
MGDRDLMSSLPLHLRLKKRAHRDTAIAQDLLVMAIYDVFPSSVIHGGTAIWRCYGGNRFSEDVDVYLWPPPEDESLGALSSALRAKGFEEMKLKRSPNALYARFSYGGTEVRLEGVFKEVPGSVVRSFELTDGARISVRTLTPDALLVEKVRAYMGRRKVRDLYDVFFLLSLAERGRGVRASLGELSKGYAPPPDEGLLRALVISGSVPSADDMMEAIRTWAGRST